MRKRRRIKPSKPDSAYTQLWRVVDGAVLDALDKHPEYIAPTASALTVRRSINKRVVGAILGYAKERRADPG